MQKRRKLMYMISLLFLGLMACNVGNNALESRIIDEEFLEVQQKRYDIFAIGNHEGQISSESTTIPSDNFPHTKAVQIQPARYEFIIVDGQQYANPEGTTELTRNEIEQNIRRRLQEGTFERKPQDIAEQPKATPEQAKAPAQVEAPAQESFDQPENQKQTAQPGRESDQGISDIEAKVIELTNAERRRNGMSDLQADSPLSHVAREKSNDMQANNYFSHTSPTYGSPFDMIRDFGVSYNAAAENIAMGQQSAEQVVQAWMDSEGHRANILNGTFKYIGVGYNEKGHYWTQMFISR